MKQVSIYLVILFAALSVTAQQNIAGSNVTITVNSSKHLQLYIDSKGYNVVNTETNNKKATITINNLETGQHSLLFVLTNPNKTGSTRTNTIFNLRHDYDMNIQLNGNGSLELIETKKTVISNNHSPMNNSDYNYLLRNVRNQRSTNGRRTVIVTAFNASNNYFTASQVSQLLRLINSENYRLELARLSYPKVTDRNNFNQVYDLLNSQASKDELEDFVNNYNEDIDDDMAMSDVEFSTLYRFIQQQWPVSSQVSSLTGAFNNLNNNFTTYQASQLIQLVNVENSRLQLAKLSYRSIIDRNNFSQIYTLLNSQSSKNELAAYVANFNDEGNSSIAMSDADFNSLYRTIQQQWPVNSQVSSLSNAFINTNNYFTVYQVSQLIQIVNGDNSRLQLAKLSYRSITDRNNFNQIYNLLSSQSSKNELAAYVSNYGGEVNPNMAMTDANFNSLYQNIQNQWPVTTQMNSLVTTFNNTNYYFSTYQASRLIQLMESENNRLQLAKLSYRSITDRANFSQIVDLLTSQSARNELTTYVNNYTGGGIGYKVPMSDADFNVFYQTLEVQFLPGEQMISLTNAFNNTSYNFTTVQVKKLIPLVSIESNRLRLAKLSYRSITDRNNFYQLYELLNSQSSRDELDAYVKAYQE